MISQIEDDLLSPGAFSAADDAYFSEHGRYLEYCRRVRVGALVTATFENAQTLGFRVRELKAYVEMTGDEAAQRQLDWYEALYPTGDRLIASLMVRDRMRAASATLASTIANGEVNLLIGSRVVAGRRIDHQTGSDPVVGLAAWIAFDFDAEDREAFADLDNPVALEVVADGYDSCSEPLTDDIRVSLLGDLMPAP